MRRRYILAGVVAILLIGFGIGWYLLSPGWTVRSMVSAAKSNDIETLSSYVDFPALKKDMKVEFTARLDAVAAGADAKDPTAKIGIAIARSSMNGVIDNYVSPEGLRMTLAAFDAADVPAGTVKVEKPGIERLGFNRFRLGREDKPGAGLVFERRGLGWELVGIDLPANPSPPPSR